MVPPFTDLRSVQTLVDGDRLSIRYGAQDVSVHDAGAYTGEISAAMLAKLGCRYVVVGHSERREYHDENDDTVNAQGAQARSARDDARSSASARGSTYARPASRSTPLAPGRRARSPGVRAEQIASLVVAYEPVWAIGTGEVATPDDAQEVCGAIRWADGGRRRTYAGGTRVLYGGSVRGEQRRRDDAQPDIDGALVGGASLDADGFAQMCAVAAGGPLP